ncbi:MAG TPA: SurA N-terminal domain-containing protein [Pyrinomonadaceae bacterium]|nr:SurA N-terminal domain-containing protein [Pyrinomonadaceae bacterium]
MQKSYLVLSTILVALASVFSTACETAGITSPNPGGSDSAAAVNGKAIKNEEVEKIIKQQFQGQESKLSPLELAQARLQALDGIIQQEVMVQKAEKEKIQVSEEEITQALNEHKQMSAVTIDEYNKRMQEAGETEASWREKLKKQLMIKKLGENIASKVEPPKDSEVEEFFKGNPELFKNKRGASFAAIVIDPKGNGQTTKTPQDAEIKIQEVGQKLSQPGIDFAQIAAQYREDPQTAARGGEWQFLAEDEMKQLMTPELTDFIMNKMTVGQVVPRIVPAEGKLLFLKLTSRNEKDEDLTLNSPNVKGRVIEMLTGAKKQLLSAAYQARSMDEARIENYLAKQIVDNPNSLSGARPADPNAGASPAATPAASPAVSPVANTNAAASPATKPAANTNAARR